METKRPLSSKITISKYNFNEIFMESQQRHKLKVFSKWCSLRKHRDCQFCEDQEETPKHLLREYDQIYELFYSCITDDGKNPS